MQLWILERIRAIVGLAMGWPLFCTRYLIGLSGFGEIASGRWNAGRIAAGRHEAPVLASQRQSIATLANGIRRWVTPANEVVLNLHGCQIDIALRALS